MVERRKVTKEELSEAAREEKKFKQSKLYEEICHLLYKSIEQEGESLTAFIHLEFALKLLSKMMIETYAERFNKKFKELTNPSYKFSLEKEIQDIVSAPIGSILDQVFEAGDNSK